MGYKIDELTVIHFQMGNFTKLWRHISVLIKFGQNKGRLTEKLT